MEAITHAEYWAEVESLADQIATEAAENESDRYDVLHETIDSHQWIIYTFYHMQILQISPNESAYFTEYGPITGGDLSSITLQLAFAALSADVSEKLGEIDEPDPEESDDESEARHDANITHFREANAIEQQDICFANYTEARAAFTDYLRLLSDEPEIAESTGSYVRNMQLASADRARNTRALLGIES